MVTAEEKHIIPTIKDFESFCAYIDQQKPKLSARMEVLGKNDAFELNARLFFRKDVLAPNYVLESYPVINLMFSLALLGGLYRKVGDSKANIYLESTPRKKEFDGLNNFEKYCFLLEVFWTQFDFEDFLRWGDDSLGEVITTFSESPVGKELRKGSFSGRIDFDLVFSYQSVLIHYLNFFGFCSFEPIISADKKLTRYDDSILKIIPNEFGINISKILCKLKLTLWNVPYLSVMGIYIKDEHYKLTKTQFIEHLKSAKQ
jgi:hypothetical protein